MAKDTYVSKILNEIIPSQINVYDSKILMIIRNYLPDFVWTMAFGMSLSLFSDNILISFLVPVVVGTCLEIAELFKFISGTFDFRDLFVELLAAILVWVILKRKKNNEK